jgi:hypothetical protein
MAYIVADRVKETTTVTGTGPATLAGAASGYRSFASQLSIGDTCAYVIVNSNASEWETGIGTYSAVNTLTRTTVQASTNANAAVVFTAGVKDVFMGPTADSLVDYNPVTGAISNAVWSGSTISTSKGGTGLTTIGTADQLLSVNSTATGLEYKTFTSNPGTVTSVSGTGTVNGLTLTGTVTSSGNLTLGGTLSNVNLASQITGTLPVANGGTGVTTSTGTGSNVLSNTPTLVTPQTNAINAVPVVSGAGNNLTLTAGSGVTSGAGGSLILQAGIQAAMTGGDGKVIVKQVAGQTSNLQEWQDSTGSALGSFSINGQISLNRGVSTGVLTGIRGAGNQDGIINVSNGTVTLGRLDTNWEICSIGQSVVVGLTMTSAGFIGWSNGSATTGGNQAPFLALYKDANDILAQRRTTNAQTFRVYNTYTDASNYERLVMDWSTTTNVGYIGFQRAGTGAARNVIVDLGGNPTAGANRIHTTGTNTVEIWSGNVQHIQCLGGNITFCGGNAYGSGATRNFGLGVSAAGNANRNADKYVFRAIGFGTGNTIPTYVGFGAAYVQSGITSTQSHTQEDCFLVRLLASATPIVAFGDSFVSTVPAIKRVGTQLRVRLADDSADASFSAQYIQTPALTVATLPSASTAGMGSRAFVSDANATTFASVVAGGGSNKVPVYSDGTNWLIG